MMSSSMCALIVAAVFMATATAAPMTEKNKGHEGKEDMKELGRFAHIQRREQNPNQQENNHCNSTKANDTIPAAYISGYLAAWAATDDDHYITHWQCDQNDGFVHGGMAFNVEKQLIVPECGYYQVSSQVVFWQGDSDSRQTSSYAYHQLMVEPNCSENEPLIETKAFATKPNTNLWITGTYTGRVFKLCAGGKIYVKITSASANACCPHGNGSYISAHLVQSTSCPQQPDE